MGLLTLWRKMLEAAGFRVAEEITLGRQIAVSRRGAHLMRDDGTYRRPGCYTPANVTSTLIVAMKGNVQKRLRTDEAEKEKWSKEWAKKNVKHLWLLPSPPDRTAWTGRGTRVPSS